MKRIFLFILTNIAVMFVLMIVFHLVCAYFNVDSAHLNEAGINYRSLAIFSLIFGMGGALISLWLSKPIAKFSVRAQVVDGSENSQTAWLVSTVEQLAMQAGLRTPEVAIYSGPANAFATGAFRNSALIAVSDEIMGQMTRAELRAVLGHEMSHIRNGDMVTMTLLQGVLNAFVIFISRIIGYVAASSGNGNRRNNGAFFLTYYVCQLVFGFFASLIVFWFSRRREYGADAGAAELLGSPSDMIAALERLGNLEPGVLPDSLKAMGIAGAKSDSIFSTHPSLENRIDALRKAQYGNGAVN